MHDELLTRTSIGVPFGAEQATGVVRSEHSAAGEDLDGEPHEQAVRPDGPLWWETRLGQLLPWRDDLLTDLPELPGKSESPAPGFFRCRDRLVWVRTAPGSQWSQALNRVDGLCRDRGDGPIVVEGGAASAVDEPGLRGMALLGMGADIQRRRRAAEEEGVAQDLPEEKEVDRIGAAEALRAFARVPNARMRSPMLKSAATSFFHQSLRCMEDVVGSVREGERLRAPVIRDCGRVVREALHLLVEDSHVAVNLVNVQTEAEYLTSYPLKVAVLAGALAVHLGHVKQSVMNLVLAALFQDLGMVAATDGVLLKPEPLTPEEWTFVHGHPERSAEIIQKSSGIPREVRLIAPQSHERIDGSGYPSALSGEQVHPLARILSMASAYVGSITPRLYRVELSPFEGVLSVLKASAAGQADPDVAEAFLQCCSCFPIGSAVRLNTGEIAKVVGTNGPALGSPVVSVICDADGDRLFLPAPSDLLTDPSVWIVDSIRASQAPDFDASYGF